MGYPQIILSNMFFYYKPSSYWGTRIYGNPKMLANVPRVIGHDGHCQICTGPVFYPTMSQWCDDINGFFNGIYIGFHGIGMDLKLGLGEKVMINNVVSLPNGQMGSCYCLATLPYDFSKDSQFRVRRVPQTWILVPSFKNDDDFPYARAIYVLCI